MTSAPEPPGDEGVRAAPPGERLAGRTARSRRTRRRGGDDREREILATAERLLADRSVHEISVDDLARGAGISRPTFYFYFPSKEAVLLTLLDRVAEEARATRDRALGDLDAPPPELWRRALAAIHETFAAHRGLTMAASELLAGSEEARELWGRVLEGFVEDTAAAIELERARGGAPAGPPARDLAVALNWMNERVLFTSFAGQRPALPPDAALDVILAVWLRAIYGHERPGGGPAAAPTGRP